MIFLEAVLRDGDVVPLAAHDGEAAPDVPPTSWGAGRDLRTWDIELAWAQRSAELAALGADCRPAPCASCSRCRARTGPS